MRIWLIHQHAIPANFPGPTRHFELAKQFIGAGHETIIFAANDCHNNSAVIAESFEKNNAYYEYQNVPFVLIDTPKYQRNNVARLWNMIYFSSHLLTKKYICQFNKPDVILGSSPSPFAAFSAMRLAKKLRVPFVYEIRDFWPETLINLGKFKRYHPLVLLFDRIERYLLNSSDHIVSVLPGAKDYLQAKKIDTSKLTWLPNFVDLSKISIAADNNDETEKFKVVYSGSFNISNDLDTLLKAAKILSHDELKNKIEIHLMGDGPEKNYLKKFVKENGLHFVKFLETRSKNEMFEYLQTADVCVGMVKDKNLYQWGTSLNKMVDYMASGKPVIFALNSPYNPVIEADAGISIAPENPQAMADAIKKMFATDQSTRIQYGKNAKKYIEQHQNLEIISARFISLFENLIEKGSAI